jgi:Tol biopolymer transport system component
MWRKIFGVSFMLTALLADICGVRVQSTDAPNLVSGPLRKNEDGFRGIYRMNRDGSHVEFVAAAPGMIANADPQLARNGHTLLFGGMQVLGDATNGKMFAIEIDGPFKDLTRDLGYGNTPSWSPDEKQIAFMVNPGNPDGIQGGAWIMNSDGTHRRWLADGWFPRFSPDGKQVVCHGAGANTANDLLLVNLNETGGSTSLLAGKDWELKMYGGNWSPDGKQIIFVGAYQGQDRVAAIDVKDETIHTLYTNDDGSQELYGPPAYSPDGKQIVFIKQDTNPGPRMWWNSYLYSISTDSSAPAKLLEGSKVGNINRGPDFSPDSAQVYFSSERQMSE